MSNFANCRTCEYKHTERGDGYCYMFKEEPTDTCRKHKLLKSEKRTPCCNPHCECPIGECSHPGFFDDRASTSEDFCMVLIEGREMPKVRHRLFADAMKEAERLLKNNNVGKAYVLRVEAVAELAPSEPVWIKK